MSTDYGNGRRWDSLGNALDAKLDEDELEIQGMYSDLPDWFYDSEEFMPSPEAGSTWYAHYIHGVMWCLAVGTCMASATNQWTEYAS